MRNLFFIFIFISGLVLKAQFNYDTRIVNLKINTSIRAISVVDDKVAWISGSNGEVGLTVDGGYGWEMYQMNGYDTMQFRSVYGFDKNKVVIANTGSPATIMLTRDGGKSWTYSYQNHDTDASINGIDFRNEQEGFAYGDPVHGEMLLLKTIDGGITWNTVKGPVLDSGEITYAGSGTGIRLIGKQGIIVSTLGINSRLITSDNNGKTWTYLNPPVKKGARSTGIFSVACLNNQEIWIASGDYLKTSSMYNNIFYTLDGGKTWVNPDNLALWLRMECIEFLAPKELIGTGPSGSVISSDKGIKWMSFSVDDGYNVIRKARKGKLVIQGGDGMVKVVTMRPK